MGINTAAEKCAYKKFIAAGMTPAGACALIGNLEAESDGFYSNRVEYLCIRRLKEYNRKYYTDESYTEAVDSGKISCEEFLHPLPGCQYGYGIAQWTSPDRKAGLYTRAKQAGKSIADEELQIKYLLDELRGNYSSVMQVLKTATSIRAASDVVLMKFESPADTSGSVCAARAARGQKFYDMYVKVKGAGKMSVKQTIESAVSWMEKMANDSTHGYDQTYRWGEKGDYDCSAAVITAFEQAGVPVKSKGATYTGNMLGVFKACGFQDVTNKITLATGAGLQRGDVLLNTAHHTAMYCGDGKEVEASINEKGTATGGKPGDQTGKEFLIRSYRNYPWTHVLRYTGGKTVSSGGASGSTAASSGTVGTCKVELKMFVQGAVDPQVKTIQRILNAIGYNGKDGKVLSVDGELGANTAYAIEQLQRKAGMNNINFGTVAAKTWELLLDAK